MCRKVEHGSSIVACKQYSGRKSEQTGSVVQWQNLGFQIRGPGFDSSHSRQFERKTMNGKEVLQALYDGKCCRRKSWPEHSGIFMDPKDKLIHDFSLSNLEGKRWPLNIEDMEADDWEVLTK